MICSQNEAPAKATVLRAVFVTVHKTTFGAVLRRKFKHQQFITKLFRGLLLLPTYVF